MTSTSAGDRLASETAHAYGVCEAITKVEARNFYYGIRLLPGPKRRALCAVYALARRIDDIGDGQLPAAQKLTALDEVRTAIRSLRSSADHDDDPVICAVRHAASLYPIPVTAFEELVDGVRFDVLGRSYTSFNDLVGYCRCVAGSIGRLCLSIFGGSGAADRPEAIELADTLGIALQQTNILRDVREDLITGRVYLPLEELDRFGVELQLGADGTLSDPDGRLATLIRHRAREAEDWYQRGLQLVPMLDRRSAACCAAMAGIYSRLLRQIEESPQRVYDRRLSLTGWQKAEVAMRALTTGTAV